MIRSFRVLALLVTSGLALASPAAATWPGSNGKIYFTCRPLGGASDGLDICSVNPDGSGLTNLTNTPAIRESQPDVSRDGSQISFIRDTASTDSHVWVANADGSGAHEVTTIPSDGASWTPDGRIAFRGLVAPSTYEFLTVPAGGGTPTTLLTGVTGSHSPPRFTVSGSYLYSAFAPIPPANTTFTQQVFVVTGSSSTRITEPQSGLMSNSFPSWSPDGGKVYYVRSSGGAFDIYSVQSAGGAETQVTNTAAPVGESWPQPAPDGTKLLWEQQDAAHDFFHKQMVIANADGSNPVPIATPTLQAATLPVWAPAQVSVTPPPPVVDPPPIVAPPPPLVVAAFTATAAKSVKAGSAVALTLRCTGDTQCVVSFTAALTVPIGGKKAKGKKYAVRINDVTVAAKGQKIVKVTLPAAAKSRIAKAIKAGKAPVFKVTATARQATNGPVIRAVTLTVKMTR